MMARRRDFVKSALLMSGASLCGPRAAASSLADATIQLTPLQKFVRIRCSEAGRRTSWWYSGQLLGRIGDTALRPLFSIVGASQTIGQWQDDGSFRYEMVEAGYYGDPDTGESADGPIINPLTGEMVQPQHYLSPQTIVFTPDLKVIPDRAVSPDVGNFSGTITPPDEKGDRIWMAERLMGQLYATAERGNRVFNSLANFEASQSDVRAESGFVPASMQYTTFNSFRPWMKMKDAVGNISSRLNALKLDRWSGVALSLRDRIKTDHPGVFIDD